MPFTPRSVDSCPNGRRCRFPELSEYLAGELDSPLVHQELSLRSWILEERSAWARLASALQQ